MVELYRKEFTGELPPLLINESAGTNLNFQQPGTLENISYKEISLFKWREIAKLHLPFDANINSAEFEFRLEYLNIDYWLPSLSVVPSSQLPVAKTRETVTAQQARTIDFKNKYTRNSGHAKEIRLIRQFDPAYKLNDQTTDTYRILNSPDLVVGYPISENLYNNRLSGFLDLIPYFIKNGSMIYGDVRQELRMQIIPNLGAGDSILLSGGYSGTVTYSLKERELTTSDNQYQITSLSPVQALGYNPNRLAFYLSNTGNSDVYFNFGSQANLSLFLTLKPKQTLTYEHGELFIDGNYQELKGDNRYRLGLPLWVRVNETSSVSVEEIYFL